MTGSRLVLRQVGEDDRWRLWAWRNSERIRRASTNDGEISRLDHDEWFTRRFPEMKDRTIIVEVDRSPIGWFQIEQWDSALRSGEWGVALGEASPVRGFGRAMPLLVHAHAFDRLHAQSLTGRVFANNARMTRVVTALGIPRAPGLDRKVERYSGEVDTLRGYHIEVDQWAEFWERGLRALIPEVAVLVRQGASSKIEE